VVRSLARLVHAPLRGLWEGIWATTIPWLALAWVGGTLVFGGAFVETVMRATGAPPSVWPSTGLAWVATGLYNMGASLGDLVVAFKSLRALAYWIIDGVFALVGAIVPFATIKASTDAWFGGVINATCALPGGLVAALGGGDMVYTASFYLTALAVVVATVALLVHLNAADAPPPTAADAPPAAAVDRRRRRADTDA
jgi:hypothetical protein